MRVQRTWAIGLLLAASSCTGLISGRQAGTTGGGTGVPDAGGPLFAYQPISTSAAVGKIKNLLIGEAPTDVEVQAVAAGLADGGSAGGSAALKQLIQGWTQAPAGQGTLSPDNLSPYQAKMLSFFATAFQQTQVSEDDFRALNDMFAGIDLGQRTALMLANNQQMFALTALQLIANGQSFTKVIDTPQFMMTPALKALYAALDTQIFEDSGKTVDLTLAANPKFSFELTGAGPIPIEEALDSGVYFTSALASTSTGQNLTADQWAACLAAQPWVLTLQSSRMRLVTNALYFSIFGDSHDTTYVLDAGPLPDGGANLIQCQPAEPPNAYGIFLDGGDYINPSDFSSWSLTTIRQPAAGESTNLYYDLPTLRQPGRDLVLHTPRVGYFTTQAFFAGWSTNSSNQARVTINQTMIVGLGQGFDITNFPFQPSNLEALDQSHAGPSTTCYTCHVTLDPMRQFFRQAYSIDFSIQTDGGQIAMPGQFAFHEPPVTGTGIGSLAGLISAHPMLAAAWVQKLCTYATSAVCDATDPEFMRIVAVFQSSNFDWNRLVSELFSSPIVTYLGETVSSDTQGETFPIARSGHLCALLSTRLNYPDVCGLLPTTAVSGAMSTVQTIAGALPSDQYSRGALSAVLADDPSLFFRTGLENVCMNVATVVIDNPKFAGSYSSADPDTAIASFARDLMGLTADRVSGPQAILASHFAEARQQGVSATTALQSTFTLACTSPYVAGLGQ